MPKVRSIKDIYPVVRHKDSYTKKRGKEAKLKSENDAEASTSAQKDDGVVDPGEIKKLRDFDLDWRFGPVTGITRVERWERAKKLGLDPPANVKKILDAHPGNKQYTNNLWIDYPL